MPKPLSRIQLLCTRFWPPPAPANASAPINVANPSSAAGNCASVMIVGTSAHAPPMANSAPMTTSSTTAATFSICARSSAV
jgi:hypothetical protein